MKNIILIILLFTLVYFNINLSYAIEIDTTLYANIGGIKQFVSIQGKNDKNPVLLYLHGGPGAATSAHKSKITEQLEKAFVVVHWDQRGAGKTLKMNPEEIPTLDLAITDAEDMLKFLLNRFKCEKIVLVANSWGNVLGFHLAENLPQNIAHFHAISPIVDLAKGQSMTKEMLIDFYKSNNNTKAVQQLSEINIPYKNIDDMLLQYRWQAQFEGEQINDEILEKKIRPYFLMWEKYWFNTYKSLYVNPIDNFKLKCPVSIFIGTKDFTTHFKLTEQFYNHLEAPEKHIYWFENAAHNIPVLHADQMQHIILQKQ